MIRTLVAAALLAGLALPASAKTVDVSAYAATLQHSSNSQQLIDACRNLTSALYVTVPIGTSGQSSPNGDAALAAMTKFVQSGHNTQARVRCARYLGNISLVGMEPPNLKTYSPYADQAIAVLFALFKDRDPLIRAGAANALWGIRSPAVGQALLHLANTDPSPIVVGAAFQTMFWAMKADIAANHDAQAYDDSIARGLRSIDSDVVVGALSAYGALHGFQANSVLRTYAASDKRPAVREGAIAAFESMMEWNKSITDFLESRLSDPDINVRDRVMLELMRFGDYHALPAIQRLAKTAPTAQERASAAAYAKAMMAYEIRNRPH
ncbi:MAG TPA: HEAT repeat domain-containing protein [Candidatus Rubrimentiphilum sp.]|nr:HEAT repeat domain-containing protein [Candidatus Rubrimentiphilum sp.]